MRYILMIISAIICIECEAIGVSSKLEFGDDSESSLVKSHQRSIPIKYKHVEIIKEKSDNLDNLGVVCSSGGCNKTNSEKDTGIVKTDVVVQVKTSVDIENKTKSNEDIPDIPVVLGTNGVGSKNNYPSIQRGLQYHPSSRNQVNRPLVVTNIEQAFPSLSSTFLPASLFGAHTSDGIDIKIKTLPPVMIAMPDGYKYKTNGVELKVPYFDPSYHNHYYGENSPPQIAYYPVKTPVHNPVAFNNIPRPTFSFSKWNRNFPVMDQNHRHDPNCQCNIENNHNTGLRWYPSSGSHVLDNKEGSRKHIGRSNDPGSQINDKLAPLN